MRQLASTGAALQKLRSCRLKDSNKFTSRTSPAECIGPASSPRALFIQVPRPTIASPLHIHSCRPAQRIDGNAGPKLRDKAAREGPLTVKHLPLRPHHSKVRKRRDPDL